MIDLGLEEWSNIDDSIGLASFSTWDGQINTSKILAQAGHLISAANLCNSYTNTDYGTGIYSDWFLPSIQQLCLLNDAVFEVNKTLDNYGNGTVKSIYSQPYWSSNEATKTESGIILTGFAYYFDFEIAAPNSFSKWNKLYSRPVRAF
jgi:hypothetical protein